MSLLPAGSPNASPTFSSPGSAYSDGSGDANWPLLEIMSMNAIEEMCAELFSRISLQHPGTLTLAEFQQLCEEDANVLGWFEALGSVF